MYIFFLTSHFGDAWRALPTLSYYDKLIPQNIDSERCELHEEEDEEACCQENFDLPDVRI